MPDNDRHYSIILKPVGSACNLRCAYCYYRDKSHNGSAVMAENVLERYVRETLALHGANAVVEFAWHGGEPTLAGLDFYSKAVTLQKRYGNGRKILNTLQTNGTLLTPEWCAFFADNDFQIGLSLDGTHALHDTYRKDHAGNGTFESVMTGLDLLRKYHVRYNTLTTVNAVNAHHATEIYAFLRTVSDYMQFLPVVEHLSERHTIAQPHGRYTEKKPDPTQLADFSVSPMDYGIFLCQIFDAWRKQDVGKKFVQIFEATLGNLMHRPAGLCVHEAVCGHCAALECNGDLYRCDRYVFEAYKMGNITCDTLDDMMQHNRAFGEYKLDSLPSQCLHCDVADLCFGGCPKDRFIPVYSSNGIGYQNYLCQGYRTFFRYFKQKIRSVIPY